MQEEQSLTRFNFRLVGDTPLLMHMDNINFTEAIAVWRKENKDISVAGDDRSPAWTWLAYVYTNRRHITMASDNLMTCIREGGAKVDTNNSKGDKTFKKIAASCIYFDNVDLDFFCNDKQIPWAPFGKMEGNNDFNAHCDLALAHGFELFAKRAKVGMSKHIRVRPLFRNWEVRGTFNVIGQEFYGLSNDKLEKIFLNAGQRCGLCDWRPGAKQSPGPYGKFHVEFEEVK